MVSDVGFLTLVISVEMELRMLKWLVEDVHDSLSHILEDREPEGVWREEVWVLLRVFSDDKDR